MTCPRDGGQSSLPRRELAPPTTPRAGWAQPVDEPLAGLPIVGVHRIIQNSMIYIWQEVTGSVRLGSFPLSYAGTRAPQGRPTVVRVPTLEEITYDAGRAALADQESLVSGIRQRTGTLLAAHALVASFLVQRWSTRRACTCLGGAAAWALVLGLVAAAILLAPWRLKFAIGARELYDELDAERALVADSLAWLAAAGFLYQDLRRENTRPVRQMTRISAALGVLMILQTLLWLAALGLH